MKRSAWFRILIGILFSAQGLGFGDETQHGPQPEGTPAADARSTEDASAEFARWAWQILDKHFAIPELASKKKFETRLPDGIKATESESDKKEDVIAGVVADVWGTINDKQALAMLTWAVKTKEDLEKKENPTEAEKKKIALLARILWAGKILKEEDPAFKDIVAQIKSANPQFEPFKKAFAPEWTRVQEKNRKYHELLAQAASTDEAKQAAAKEALGKGYLGTTRFLTGQVSSGNDGLVNQIADASSFELPSDKNRVMDFVGAEGKPVRIVLGKDSTGFAKALREGFEQKDLFPESAIAQSEISPKRFEKVDTAIWPASVPKTQVVDRDEKKSVEVLDKEVAHFLGKNCVTCHDPTSARGFKVDDQGKILTNYNAEDLSKVLLDRKGLKPDGTMEGIKVSPEDQQLLSAWRAAHAAPPAEVKTEPTVTEPAGPPKSLTEAIEQRTLTQEDLIHPFDLAVELKALNPKETPPVIWNIGPESGEEATLPGAVAVGTVLSDEGATKLRQLLADQKDKRTQITLYCGCCPSEHCPPLLTAVDEAKKAGFNNLRIVNFRNGIEDWDTAARASGLK